MKRKRLTTETKEEIVRLCREGLKRDDIADRTGVAYASCGTVIRRARAEGRLPCGILGRRSISQDVKEEIFRLRNESLGFREVAKRVGVSLATAARYYREECERRSVSPITIAPKKKCKKREKHRTGRPAVAQEVRDRIYRMRHEEMLSIRAVAARLGISAAGVAKYYRIECARRGKTPITIRPSEYKKRTKAIKKPEVTKPRRRRGYRAACRCCNGEVRFKVDMELDIINRLQRASGACDGCDQFYWLKDLLDVESLIMRD